MRKRISEIASAFFGFTSAIRDTYSQHTMYAHRSRASLSRICDNIWRFISSICAAFSVSFSLPAGSMLGTEDAPPMFPPVFRSLPTHLRHRHAALRGVRAEWPRARDRSSSHVNHGRERRSALKNVEVVLRLAAARIEVQDHKIAQVDAWRRSYLDISQSHRPCLTNYAVEVHIGHPFSPKSILLKSALSSSRGFIPTTHFTLVSLIPSLASALVAFLPSLFLLFECSW